MPPAERPRCPVSALAADCAFLCHGRCCNANWNGQVCPADKVSNDVFQRSLHVSKTSPSKEEELPASEADEDQGER